MGGDGAGVIRWNTSIGLVIIGILSSTVSMIAGFYYGSSKGSQKKDDTITNMTEKMKS